ncbi:class I SAM-dependent rRNA methyltransferase [Roseiconus nitratireducens]|uniref:Class I SAM-dependent rRNA methyltransferase n=1 Tax=Roseiconus nitratireducens TaxID=2605748 RepID=A0A5M6DE97_9BACT|nr:class I SAM-dependent rRNA methyltransferase [Roseiconus nitratireducens]KAA5544612.1 class I SAM-dependent rRNA methyltransferase [Roseiconus nitratireducens]
MRFVILPPPQAGVLPAAAPSFTGAAPVSDNLASDDSVSESNLPQLRLKPGRQFPFLSRHPWVHAHALVTDGAELQIGQAVDLVDMDGNFLARGLVNPNSRLRVRLYSYDSRTEIGEALWKERIDAAIARRRLTGTFDPQGAERLVFSESDLISGLIVDRYADSLGVQFTAGALMNWRQAILEHLRHSCDARQIVVRVDEKTAKYEGVEPESGTLEIDTAPDSEPVAYRQNDLDLTVDLVGGQKTGGYLDQRANHAAAAGYLVGRRVLDVCCYTGGFGLVAAKRGASEIVGIDSSAPAIAAAQASAQRNGLSDRMRFEQGDCFDLLKRMKGEGQTFDAVVLDPPRFAGSRHQVDQALRAYRRLNRSAVELLPVGGILVTCSCSGRVSRSDFLNMLVEVGRRCERDIIVLENRGPSPDHPLAVGCPESDYLKCVIAQVM